MAAQAKFYTLNFFGQNPLSETLCNTLLGQDLNNSMPKGEVAFLHPKGHLSWQVRFPLNETYFFKERYLFNVGKVAIFLKTSFFLETALLLKISTTY